MSNEWNDFQHEQAGQGMSKSDMSEMYQAEQSGSIGDSGRSDESTAISSMTIENDDGIDDITLNDVAGASHDTAGTDGENEHDETTSSNSWNQYQHEHAGQGMSKSDMSEMYQAEQSGSIGDSGRSDESTAISSMTIENDDDIDDITLNDVAGASHDTAGTDGENKHDETTSSNSWNQYQHEHAGQGMSKSEMSADYQAGKDNTSDTNNDRETDTNVQPSSSDVNTQQPAEKETEGSSFPSPASREETHLSTNQWNQHQHAHGGENLTQEQVSAGYQAQKNTSDQNDMNTSNQKTDANNNVNEDTDIESMFPSSGSDVKMQHPQQQTQAPSSTDSESQLKNAWNVYQHEHAGQNLTQEQMSAGYQVQKENNNSLLSDRTDSRQESNENDQNTISTSPSESTNVASQVQTLAEQPITSNSTNTSNNEHESKTRWIEYEHAHKGQHLNSTQLAERYGRDQAQQQLQEGQYT
ncbi:unnamed protein product, partial [Didymodactylos carnosus]